MKKTTLGTLLFACALNSQAAMVTWDFSGRTGGVGPELAEMLAYGTAYTGSITFDDSGIPGRLTSDETNYATIYDNILDFRVDFASGYYVHSDGGGFNLKGNMAVVSGTDAGTRVDELLINTGIVLNNNYPTLTTNVDGLVLDNLGINFRDASGAFYGDQLPDLSSLVLPDQIRDPYLSLWFSDINENSISLSTRIDSVSVSAVPVPAAVWLFGSGLIGLIGVSTRRKKK